MKKIKVDLVTRVEGHGNIYIEIYKNKFKSIKFEIPEGPRLFETLVLNKTPEEVLNIVCRICAICNVSHRYSAIRALEKIGNIKVPNEIILLRDLAHYGEMLESHALHLFFLALPDFLGFPDAISMAEKFPDLVQIGLRIKKFGNSIMEKILGRMMHGENMIIGGFGRYLTAEELMDIKKEAEQLLPEAIKSWEVTRDLHYTTFCEESMLFVCLKPPTDEYGFWGDEVLISNGEEYPIEKFYSLIEERIVPHSSAKHSYYQNRPYMVGALARMSLLGERLHNASAEAFKKSYSLSWIRNPLYNNLAQAIEIIFSLEKVISTAEELLKKTPFKETLITYQKFNGKAVGSVEAPRGTLFHYYEFKNKKCAKANLIIPTAQNYASIEQHLKVCVCNIIKKFGVKEEELISESEKIIRAYDPCISCSCHIVRTS
ncbi:MAG: Ni/Fe hydrogenase subunit alpha [candidate division WOR-3 bacterium]|uniref:Ni/Fe hydrogenase subunit alpha n=1 Tax=candidate division WOR-3 bacterium TaxID=2052148 RepID=A0A7C4VYF4_UNCW3